MDINTFNHVLQELLAVDPEAKILESGPTWIRWECRGVRGHYSTSTSVLGVWRSLIGSGPSVRDAVGLSWVISDPVVVPPMSKSVGPRFYGFDEDEDE